MRLLLAEDELKVADFVTKGLRAGGHDVTICHRGDTALELVSTRSFDALVLDVMMPGYDGLEVIRRLRVEHNVIPVVLVTARDGVADRITGLNLGADDYISKPFSVDELLARLAAVGRRLRREDLNLVQLGDLVVNLVSREVRRGNRKVELAPKEFALLAYLLGSPGRVHTRSQICWHVWNYHFTASTNVVDVAVQRLRRKVDQPPAVPLLHTVRGIGYTARLAP